MANEIELISVAEFEDHLGRLLEVSARNGIDFDRSWTFRLPGNETPDMMVEITCLRKSSEDTVDR